MTYVTCVICALNEEKNILDCIGSIRALPGFEDFEIKVYDGGSTDDTVKLARFACVPVIEAPGSSLSYRRQLAADESSSEFIFYVDADHRIDCLDLHIDCVLKKYFESSLIAGIMFRKKSDATDYWSVGFNHRCDLIQKQAHQPKVIGMPCIFRSKLVKEVRFDQRATGPIDDTMLCTRLGESGYAFLIADEYVIEKFRSSFWLTVRKAYWYGLGDAEFISINQGPLVSKHVFHVIIRNLIFYPLFSLIRWPLFFPFFLCFGFARALGMIIGLKKTDLSRHKS